MKNRTGGGGILLIEVFLSIERKDIEKEETYEEKNTVTAGGTVLSVQLCCPAVFAGEESGSVNIVVKNLNQKEKDTFTSFDEAYDYYTKGNPDDKIPVFQWSWAENDVALIELQNNDSMTFAFEQEEGQDAAKAFEITHDTCITLRTPMARKPDAVKEVTITVDTPIVVKSGHYLILRSQGMGYDNEYSTVKLNCSITVEDGATLLLDAPNITPQPTGPRDIYVGPENGPAIVAEKGATVRLGGVILQPNAANESPFIQAKGATVIVQAGNSVDTAKGNNAKGDLPAVDNTRYHSNAFAQTAGAPVIAATEGAEVQLLGGNIVSTGTNPADYGRWFQQYQNRYGEMQRGRISTDRELNLRENQRQAISIASNGALELGDYAPATSENNELQAINLAAGVTVKKGDLTVCTAEDESGDNYVDNYGNLVSLRKVRLLVKKPLMASTVIPEKRHYHSGQRRCCT